MRGLFKWGFGYLIIAWLVGFWPFENGFLRTSDLSPFQYTYDQGYQDGYDGNKIKTYESPYIDGYDDGEFDGDCDWLKYDKRDLREYYRIGCDKR